MDVAYLQKVCIVYWAPHLGRESEISLELAKSYIKVKRVDRRRNFFLVQWRFYELWNSEFLVMWWPSFKAGEIVHVPYNTNVPEL